MESPLKDSDLRSMNKALYQLNDMLIPIDKAESCGIDCQEVKLRRDDMVAKLTALKAAYFPGR